MRRAPITSDANTSAIAALQSDMASIKKSVAGVERLQTTVESLGEQMQSLIKWQQTEANPAIVLAKQGAAANAEMSKRVAHLESSQFAKSAFTEWVEQEFEPIRELARQALPKSDFEAFLAASEDDEQFRVTTIQHDDTEMERGAVTGAKRTVRPHTDSDDADSESGGPAARAKRRHGRMPASTPSGTPGADAFSIAPPPVPKTPEKQIRKDGRGPPGTPVEAVRSTAEDDEEAPWLAMGPTPKSSWSEQALDLLLKEWSKTCDQRMSRWVHRHCGLEMTATAVAVADEEELTEEKKGGIRAILTQSRMPPRAFTNLQPPQLK